MMEDEFNKRRKAVLDAKRKDIADEENHYATLRRVFNTDDGIAVVKWLLSDLCEFWCSSVDDNNREKFNVGRTFFHHLTLADVGICTRILAERRADVDAARINDKNLIEKEAKEF